MGDFKLMQIQAALCCCGRLTLFHRCEDKTWAHYLVVRLIRQSACRIWQPRGEDGKVGHAVVKAESKVNRNRDETSGGEWESDLEVEWVATNEPVSAIASRIPVQLSNEGNSTDKKQNT